VIGLAHPNPPWPFPLAGHGYTVHRIEQPVGTELGRVVVDLLLAAVERSAIFAVECKDGSVQAEQAAKYGSMTALDVIQTAGLNLPHPDRATLDVACAVRSSNADPTLTALAKAPGTIGVLSVGAKIAWVGDRARDAGLRQAFAAPLEADLRAIPRLLLADDASPAHVLASALANELQSAIERGRESMTVASLMEAACWGWPRYGRAFKGKLTRAVAEMLQAASKNELAGVISVEKASAQSERVVRLVSTEIAASTQAGELRAARALRIKLEAFVARVTGKPTPAPPGQMELDWTPNEDFDEEADDQW
jgi:hypothetical protein